MRGRRGPGRGLLLLAASSSSLAFLAILAWLGVVLVAGDRENDPAAWIVTEKLDAVEASLESLSRRIEELEREIPARPAGATNSVRGRGSVEGEAGGEPAKLTGTIEKIRARLESLEEPERLARLAREGRRVLALEKAREAARILEDRTLPLEVRLDAFSRIRKIRPPELEELESVLRIAGDPELELGPRSEALERLAGVERPEIVEPLLEQFGTEPEPALRGVMLEVLFYHGARVEVQELFRQTIQGDPEPRIREHATRLLPKVEWFARRAEETAAEGAREP